MALKFKHQSKDEIPEAQRALYVERDGAFLLDVEGAADKAKLDEFRANNIALSNELTDLKQRFATEGAEPSPMTREQFTKFIANEITRWRKVALDANIKPE